ncbi:RuBisCO large subunit C-terminal-like domain-containing protein [Virgibacillus kimchii]
MLLIISLYDPNIFNYSQESIEDNDYIIATYYFKKEAVDHLNLVGFMALESSTGGWMDFPGETVDVRRKLGAKVVGYYPIPLSEGNEKAAIVHIAYPVKGSAGWNSSVSMLLTTIAGNILDMPGDVYLIDVKLPPSFTDNFSGPKFGVEGIRDVLGVPTRPLVNMMIKPKVGLNEKEIEQMSYEAGIGGVDHIKDDEIMSEVYNLNLEKRILSVMKGLKRAEEETGNKALYTVNITGTGYDLTKRAEKAVELGANAIMLNFHQGLESLRLLAENPNVNVPILFHPAGSFSINSIGKMVLSKLSRLCGADFYLPGSPWAKWSKTSELESTIRSAQLLSTSFYDIKKTFIVQSSTAGKVPTIIQDYGMDVVLGGGGAIHGHPSGIKSGVMAIHQAINAAIFGEKLEDYAKDHEELEEALNVSPVFKRPQETRY